jgi:ABC-type polysaccharide/polyol phosphate export permease
MVAIDGSWPHVHVIVYAYLIGLAIAAVGLWFFERARRGFADVV